MALRWHQEMDLYLFQYFNRHFTYTFRTRGYLLHQSAIWENNELLQKPNAFTAALVLKASFSSKKGSTLM